MLSKRDDGISLVRVFAMLLIIVTHILNEIPSVNSLGQATNAAVYTFIFISGILYGPRDIKNGLEWFIDRLKIILIPMYVVLMSVVIWMYFSGEQIDFLKVGAYLINIQGFWGTFGGIGHMWFLTLIMLCYFVTPLLSYMDKKIFNYKFILLFLFFVSIVVVFSAQLLSVGVSRFFSYIGLYVLAYSASNFWNREIKNSTFIIISLSVLIFVFIRVLSRRYFDGSSLYDGIIVPLSQAALGYYIFIFLYKTKRFWLEKMKLKKMVSFFDKYTFELYLVHYPLIVGPFFIWGTTRNIFFDSILVFVVSFLLAYHFKNGIRNHYAI